MRREALAALMNRNVVCAGTDVDDVHHHGAGRREKQEKEPPAAGG